MVESIDLEQVPLHKQFRILQTIVSKKICSELNNLQTIPNIPKHYLVLNILIQNNGASELAGWQRMIDDD